jgi:hypothetical protein
MAARKRSDSEKFEHGWQSGSMARDLSSSGDDALPERSTHEAVSRAAAMAAVALMDPRGCVW